MTGTTPQCTYIGGHADGYDPECHWCFDNAAWDYAGKVAAGYVRAFNHRSDKRLAKMTAPALPVMGYAVYLMADAGDWWWAAAFAVITTVMSVCLVGMYRGWDS